VTEVNDPGREASGKVRSVAERCGAVGHRRFRGGDTACVAGPDPEPSPSVLW